MRNQQKSPLDNRSDTKYFVSEIHSRDRISVLLMLELSFYSKKLILVQARAAEKTKVDKDHNLFAKPRSKNKDFEYPS